MFREILARVGNAIVKLRDEGEPLLSGLPEDLRDRIRDSSLENLPRTIYLINEELLARNKKVLSSGNIEDAHYLNAYENRKSLVISGDILQMVRRKDDFGKKC